MIRYIFLLATVTLVANALDKQACSQARVACFDEWAKLEDCNATRKYNDCIGNVKKRGICPQDTVTVEDIYDASVDCGLIPKRKQHVFPVFTTRDQKYLYLPRFVDSDGTKMYEYVYNLRTSYQNAADFCAQAGGTLFIPRHHYNMISLDTFFGRNIKNNGDNNLYFTGPSENGKGEYWVGKYSNNQDKFWIGANDIAKEAEFRFEDGSTVSWDFFAPHQGHHDTGFLGGLRRMGQDCVAMDMNAFHGYVLNCNEKRTFVCQYRGTPKYE